MRYLSAQDILVIHAKLIDETDGMHGIRDISLLQSALMRPQARFGGRDAYKGVFEKAAVYLQSIAMNHAFVGGNKRTAITVTARFLFVNKYRLEVSNKSLEKFVLQVVVDKLETKEIAKWLKTNSKKVK